MPDRARSGSNAALFINPNNPTSLYIPKKTMVGLLEELRDLDLILLDESFESSTGNARPT
ncbi:MAG: hypothetical protein MUP19_04145 [Candidatus Aminicenantes bacterium]|nr:hypothetical protein [Candidatus Aminicenantes bacterium]